MAKQLKYWNGRGNGKYQNQHINIAAYSQKQAAELLGIACGFARGSLGEIRIYFSNCWGDNMNGIKPENPCVYVNEKFSDKPPILVYELTAPKQLRTK